MKIDISRGGGPVTVTVAGRLDAASAAAFDSAVEGLPASEPPARILIDLSKLEFISSAGLRCLLTLGKACRASGTPLAFCSLTPMVADVFKISGFTSIFSVFSSSEEALESGWGGAA